MTTKQVRNAETAILSIVMRHPDALRGIQVRASDFAIQDNAFIFGAFQDVIADGLALNTDTVTECLKQDDRYSVEGCDEFRLWGLLARRQPLESLAGYIEIIRGPEADEFVPQCPGEWIWSDFKGTFAPREPVQYVVDGYFALPSLNIVYGVPGGMKSILMTDCAVAVAAGMPWLPADFQDPDSDSVETKKVPVRWIDFDNGHNLTTERIEATCRARGIDVNSDIDLKYVALPRPQLQCDDASNVLSLIDALVLQGAKLIILDNLGTISGATEENSSDMQKVMANLRLMAERTGAAVVVIHHQRKGGTGAKVRIGETLRGHSSIEASLDTAFLVHRVGDDPENGNEVELLCSKSRRLYPETREATFSFIHRSNTKDLYACHFTGHRKVSLYSKMNKVMQAALKAEPGMNQTALIKLLHEECGTARTKTEKFLASSEKDNWVQVQRGARNSKLYYSKEYQFPSSPELSTDLGKLGNSES